MSMIMIRRVRLSPLRPILVALVFVLAALGPTTTMADPFVVETAMPPPQAPAGEGMAAVGDGTRLWYWDTGGNGPVVVLLHAGVGSGAMWPYQQPALAAAGYRVIGYSRRGFYRSDAGPKEQPGTAAGDLLKLLDGLGVNRFHLVGTAAGGIYATDLALAEPKRVISLTIACSLVTVDDDAYMKQSAALRPKGFNEMPASFRELGPAYRAAHAEGVALWDRLQSEAVHTNFRQPLLGKLTLDALESLTMPVLMLTGDADLYTPPPMLKKMADRVKNGRTAVVDGAGHSAHWEQPAAFNRLLLDFLAAHRG